ncbi:MAG: SHOCT domain-containing protein [Planctomycetota bacterium]|jgi:putative membrane protein
MKSLLIRSGIAINAFAVSSVTWAQQQDWPYHGPHMWGGGWWMFLGPLMFIVFIAAMVAAVVVIVRWLSGSHGAAPPSPPGKTPLDILKERYARGEIDKEEFEERRRVLDESG